MESVYCVLCRCIVFITPQKLNALMLYTNNRTHAKTHQHTKAPHTNLRVSVLCENRRFERGHATYTTQALAENRRCFSWWSRMVCSFAWRLELSNELFSGEQILTKLLPKSASSINYSTHTQVGLWVWISQNNTSSTLTKNADWTFIHKSTDRIFEYKLQLKGLSTSSFTPFYLISPLSLSPAEFEAIN